MFHTQMKNGVTFLTAGALASDGIRHGFSTRLGGVSPAPWDSLNLDDRRGDDIANVQENFRRLCAALDMDVRRAVLSRQIHRDDVRLVTAADCGKGLWFPQDYDSADALITDVPAALREVLGVEAEPFMAWNGQKWHIDLKAVNALWLQKAGVRHIDLCGDCTYCRPDLYWSHRKTGLRRGEQAALISLREVTP